MWFPPAAMAVTSPGGSDEKATVFGHRHVFLMADTQLARPIRAERKERHRHYSVLPSTDRGLGLHGQFLSGATTTLPTTAYTVVHLQAQS